MPPEYAAAGKGRSEILDLYPYLEPADIDEALSYAGFAPTICSERYSGSSGP